MNGLELFGKFAFRPNQLKYCGEEGFWKHFLQYLNSGETEENLRSKMKSFPVAFPFLSLIARKNCAEDFLDERVVEAYWIGNSLLEQVKAEDINKLVLNELTKNESLQENIAQEIAKKIPFSAFSHHSLHVFLLHAASGTEPRMAKHLDSCRISWGEVLKVKGETRMAKHLDSCRISWGEVLKVKGEKATVLFNPISRSNGKFLLSEPKEKEIAVPKEFSLQLERGDFAAFHWNTAAVKLSPKQLANLKKYTEHNLKAVNSF